MKKLLQLSIVFVLFSSSNAQVGIGTTSPNTSSSLDITSTTSGVLIPRVNLVNILNGTTPVSAPATSLLVYNTNASVVGGNGVGYYFWDGAKWTKLFDENSTVPQYWSRGGFGQLFPTTLSDYVGIGTNNPQTNLHVISSSSNPVIFDGGSFLYLTFAENGVNRGYFGSFAGNPEDIELGTYSGNLGAVHLTTNNSPKLTVINNGNIGIGTTNPAQKLDIQGKIKITDGTQGVGKVLSSDANGVGTWVNNTAITPAVLGSFPGGGANIGNGTPVGVQSPMTYCNVNIVLPPGKWIVFGTYLLAGTTSLTAGQSVFVRTTLSSSNTVLNGSDIISGGLVSGTLIGPCDFGLANGQTIINNTSGANKTYYLWANVQKFGTTPTAFTMAGVGSNFWSENQLSAIPTN